VKQADEARVWRVVQAIPRGRVASYGDVAREAGLGRRARFVGQVLARLPPGSDVPWHRVLRADGSLGFPPGSASWERQRALLVAEGVAFRGLRVELARHRWRPSLDALLWGHC
jgi:methylated-DNA-protein-cysteine methyltransferase related protein